MKKNILAITVATLLLTLVVGCSSSDNKVKEVQETDEDKTIKIGIIQPIEHPSLNQIRDSIIEGLEEEGLKENVEITYKDAQGDPSNINTIISQFVGDGMNVIVPIATSPAQSAAAATKDIPVVFAAVSYPVEAGLVVDMNKPEANITGVSDAIDVNEIFGLAKTLTPDVETFGFIYNSGEVNSVSAIEMARKYCDANGLKYEEVTITNSSELLQATQSLIGKVDAIFTPTDNTVASAMPILSAEAIKSGIPVYTGADSMVGDGGLATVGIDYTILGKQVANIVKRVIDGEQISDIPVETLKEYTKVINVTTAKELGIKISEEALEGFQVVE